MKVKNELILSSIKMAEIKQSYCVGSRHMSGNINPKVTEKINPRTKKRVKIIRSKCSICGKNKSQIFTM